MQFEERVVMTIQRGKPQGKRGEKEKMYLGNSVGGGSQKGLGGSHRSSVAGEEEASLKGVEDRLVGEEGRKRRAKARR